MTLVPDDPLAPGTAFTVTIDPSVADAAGNALGAPVSWSFTTATPPGEVVDDTAAEFAADHRTGHLRVGDRRRRR